MSRISSLGAVAATAVMVALVFASPMSAGDASKKWTVMVYLDADNSLESFGWMNLEWLESVGSTDEVNFLVLMDTMTTETELLYVEKGQSVRVDTTGTGYDLPNEENMGDGKLLEWFIELCCERYPADRYIIDLWDHGGAFNGICWDDSYYEETGIEDCILLPEMREAFWGAYNTTGEVIDVVACDACLMAMPEVAYQLRGLADYMVMSEEVVPGQGFPYNAIASELVANPDMDGAGLSTLIVSEYAEFYSSMLGYNDWTMSAFDMSYMDELTTAIDVLAQEMLRTLPTYVNRFINDRAQAEEYYYFYDIDLMSFAENLVMDSGITDKALKTAASNVVKVVDDGILLSLNSWPHRESHGLAIYFPKCPGGVYSMKDIYITIPFGQDTAWYVFIDAFSNYNGRTWVAEKLSR